MWFATDVKLTATMPEGFGYLSEALKLHMQVGTNTRNHIAYVL